MVREYLAKNFKFDDKRLKTIGLGKALEADESDKVEIVVYPATVASATRPAERSHSGN